MKLLFAVLLIALTGCASDGPRQNYAPISPTRLYWPNKVDTLVTPSGTVYIVKGKRK